MANQNLLQKLQTTTISSDGAFYVLNNSSTTPVDNYILKSDLIAQIGTPIYPDTLIPFGDGSTAGGITNSSLVYDTANGIFNAGFNNTNLSLDASTQILEYNSNDPWLRLDGANRRFQFGDLTFDFFGTWIDINDDSASQNITLRANNGVIVNNLAGFGTGIATLDNTGLLGFTATIPAASVASGTPYGVGFFDGAGVLTSNDNLINQPNGVGNQVFAILDGSIPVFQISNNNAINQIYSIGAGTVATPAHVGNGTIFEINDSLQISAFYGLYGGFYNNSLIEADFLNGIVLLGPKNGGNDTQYRLDDDDLYQGMITNVSSGQIATIEEQTNILGLGIKGVAVTSVIGSNNFDGLIAGDLTSVGQTANTTIVGHLSTTGGSPAANTVYTFDSNTGEGALFTEAGNGTDATVLSMTSSLISWGTSRNDGTLAFQINNSDGNPSFETSNDLGVRFPNYPSTRNDSGSFFPVNVLYTNNSGDVLSALVSDIIPTPTIPTLTQVLTQANTNSSIPIVGNNFMQVTGALQNVLLSASNIPLIQVDGNENPVLLGTTGIGTAGTGNRIGFDSNANVLIGDPSQAFGLFDNTNNQTTFTGKTQSLGSTTYTPTGGSGINDLTASITGVYDVSGSTTYTLTLTVVFEQLEFTTTSGTFAPGDTVVGAVSGATGTIDNIAFGTVMTVVHTSGDGMPLFQVGEILNDTTSGAVGQYTNFNNKGNEFDWTDSQGGSGTGASTTSSPQLLSHGVSVTWPTGNYGYTLGNQWSFTVMPVQYPWAQYDGTTNYTLLQNEDGVLKLGDYSGAINGGVVLLDNTGANPSFEFGKLGIGDSIQASAGTNPIVTIGAADGQGNGNIVKVDDNANIISAISTTGALLIGDPNAISGGWVINIDNTSPSTGGIDIGKSTVGSVLSMGFQSTNVIVELGDLDFAGNGTLFFLDDSTQTMTANARIISLGDLTPSGNATKISLDDTVQTVDFTGFYNSVVGASLFNINWQFGNVFVGDWDGSGNGTVLQVDDLNSTVTINCQGLEYFFLDGPNHAVDFGVFADITTLNFNGSIVESGIGSTTYGGTLNYAGGFVGNACAIFAGGAGASGVLLPTTTIAAIGSVFTVDDGDGSCSVVNTITIDAGSGNTILGTTSAQTYVMNQAGQSIRLRKISNSLWKVE